MKDIMKGLKILLLIAVTLAFVHSCKEDDITYDFSEIPEPTEVSANFDISSDDSGLVTILPTGTAVSSFEIFFGDVENEEPTIVSPGKSAEHIYAEGTFDVRVVGVGPSGLKNEFMQSIMVSFRAPENLVLTVNQDPINPAIITVGASADFATLFDVYFGDETTDEPSAVLMPNETIQHIYEVPGEYTVRVVARGAGAATAETSQVVIIPEANDPVTLPIDFESFTVNYGFVSFGNVGATVVDNPNPMGLNDSARVGELTKPTGAEVWGGSFLQLDAPIDFSVNTLFKVKVFSPKSGIVVKLKVENATDGAIAYEVDVVNTVANDWEELTFDFSGIDITQSYQKVVIFFDFGVGGDDTVYLFDDISLTSSITANIEGVWKLAPEAGALGVGPAPGDVSWFNCDAGCVTARACYFDDLYVFDPDGTFSNVLEGETWIEPWQGGSEACGLPVAPHNGATNPATYSYDASTGSLVVNGEGAYIGLPKANNQGELPNVGVPASITYDVVFLDNDTISVVIEAGAGVFWQFKLIRATPAAPIEGVWRMAPEAGALGVGPAIGDISWFGCDLVCVGARACYYNDLYVFNADGTFSNVMGGDTWVEAWQGGSESCSTPVAPHNGAELGTYSYDQGGATLTINGEGLFVGLAKANNQGELPNVAVPSSITYSVQALNNNMLELSIEAGAGVFWQFKLVRL